MKKHRNHRPTQAAGAPDTLQRAAAETLGLAAAQSAPTDLPAAANLAAPAIPAAQNAPAGRSPLATLSPATAAQADAPATPSPAASNAAAPVCECRPWDISGSSSSTTTYSIAPAAKLRRYGSAGKNAQRPCPAACSSAGASRLQNVAATMTPAANPVSARCNPSGSARFIKNTHPAPSAVPKNGSASP